MARKPKWSKSHLVKLATGPDETMFLDISVGDDHLCLGAVFMQGKRGALRVSRRFAPRRMDDEAGVGGGPRRLDVEEQ